MHIPWYVYILVLFLGFIAGAVGVVAGIDPEGRGARVSSTSFVALLLLAAVLVILVVLDFVRWISTS